MDLMDSDSDHGGRPTPPIAAAVGEEENDSGASAAHLGDMVVDETLSALFKVDDCSYEVMLNSREIRWKIVWQGQGKRQRKPLLRHYYDRDDMTEGTIPMENIYSAKIRRKFSYKHSMASGSSHRQENSNNHTDGGVCTGFGVFTFEHKQPNILKDCCLFFQCKSDDVCVRWVEHLERSIQGIYDRPRKMTVFIPHRRNHVYDSKVLPILKLAGCELSVCEVTNATTLMHFVNDDELISQADAIIVVGDDIFFTSVITSVMVSVQTDSSDYDTYSDSTRPILSSVRTPLGLIPASDNNSSIAYSIHGCVDPITATLHAVLGHQMEADVSCVYLNGKFEKFAFNGEYGFFSKVQQLANRYSSWVGKKNVEAAFIKSLTKLRSYECEISFISAPTTVMTLEPCRTGCEVCRNVFPDSRCTSPSSLQIDNDPLALSNTSQNIIDLGADNPWRTIRGNYVSVGFYTNPAPSEIAPLGMCKNSHIGDGCLELILVRDVDRRNFARFLRRHGNDKDPLDLPFVETHRVKQFHMVSTAQHQVCSQQSGGVSRSVTFGDIQGSRSDTGGKKHGTSPHSILTSTTSLHSKLATIADDEGEDCEANTIYPGIPKQQHPVAPPPKLLGRMAQHSRSWSGANTSRSLSERRGGRSSVASRTSSWSVDGALQHGENSIGVRVHPHVIRVFGNGLSPDTRIKEQTLSWIPLI